MGGGGGVQEFGDGGSGLSGRTRDGDSRRGLATDTGLVLLGAQLGGRDVAQLLDVQDEAVLVLGDDDVVALQEAVVQLELVGSAFGLLALVLLGGCGSE